MSLSIEALCQPVSEELPSGENLEYDAQFVELVNLFEAKPKAGASVGGSEETGPDWKAIARLAGKLSEQTRDLRIQVYSTIASIHTGGMPALRDNLKVLKAYVGDFWDTVHPQLDPDDNNDPILRANTLENLNEYSLISLGLERVKLVEMKGLGVFTPRSVALSEGKEEPDEGEEVPDSNLIRQAFASADPDEVAKVVSAANESVALLGEINTAWKEKSGDSAGLVLGNAEKALGRVRSILADYCPVAEEAAVAEGGEAEGEAVPGAPTAAPAVSGAINSRSDVIKSIDRICDYYAANEPSSPVPMLLRRAQRMVDKSFIEILEDMVPDGVKTAKLVGGEE